MFTLSELEAAVALVHAQMPATPQYDWPLLSRRIGAEVWVKHENHTPIGAFKIRGGIVYAHELLRQGPPPAGLITATRGNHGQSIARAASRAGLASTILVPHGNSREKNRAMAAFGARLIEHGHDFDEARLEADRLATAEGLHFVPAFHPWLVRGVATYAFELFRACGALDTVYAPIGMGSGICGLIATRYLLGLDTEIVGVVAKEAPAVALSFANRRATASNAPPRTFADGVACRVPHQGAIDIIVEGAARIVTVSEDEIAEAMRMLYEDTHNLAEGAGAASLAALVQEHALQQGRRVGVILSGGNIDREAFQQVLDGRTPRVGHA